MSFYSYHKLSLSLIFALHSKIKKASRPDEKHQQEHWFLTRNVVLNSYTVGGNLYSHNVFRLFKDAF